MLQPTLSSRQLQRINKTTTTTSPTTAAAADQQCKHVNAIGAVATAMAPYTDTESAPVVRTKSAMSAKELSRWGAFAKVENQRSAARYQHQPGTVAKVDVCGHIGEHRRGRSGDSGQLRC